MTASGPLVGVKVLEIAGIGPAPTCGMMLADMGAEVILLERKPTLTPQRSTIKTRALFSSAANVQSLWT